MKNWRLLALGAGSALVLAAVAVTAVFLFSGGSKSSSPGAAPPPAQAHSAAAAASALSKLATDPQSLVASGSTAQTALRAQAAVPKGTKVVADQPSWHSDGSHGSMVVTLTPPSGQPQTYLATMVYENGWKVLGTLAMPAAIASATP